MTSGRFKLTRVSGQPVVESELLADLKRVAEMLGVSTVSMPTYRKYGQYDESNVARRFGSWNNALLKANLALSNEVNISDDRLFENILTIWQHYGRQPRRNALTGKAAINSFTKSLQETIWFMDCGLTSLR